MFIDYHFSYKYTLRNILINKLSYPKNTYRVPIIDKFVLFIPIIDSDNLNLRECYNYFYMFKFYFGKRAFISSYKDNSSLGISMYSFKVQLILHKSNIYNCLFFLSNDIFINIDKLFLSYGIFSKSLNIYYIILKDLHIFSEKKTNLGLFNLKSEMHFNIYIKGCCFEDSSILLKSFKLNLF